MTGPAANAPTAPASSWLLDHLAAIGDAARLGPVVDLACGRGRHSLEVARRGTACIGLDRNPNHLHELERAARRAGLPVSCARMDLETENGIALKPESCGAILVFRFLYRPLASEIIRSLAPGGLLVYETFAAPHRATGRGPRSEAFYLKSGELLELFAPLEVIGHEEGPTGAEPVDITARLAARKRRS